MDYYDRQKQSKETQAKLDSIIQNAADNPPSDKQMDRYINWWLSLPKTNPNAAADVCGKINR